MSSLALAITSEVGCINSKGVATINLNSIKNNKYCIYAVRLMYMAIFPIINIIYFILNRPREKTYNLYINVDGMIPFSPIFIIPYIIWYIYLFGALVYFCFYNYDCYKKILLAMTLGLLICYAIFLFFPTTVERPVVEGNSFLDSLVRMIYENDNPYNCFPSIHVMQSIIIMLFISRKTALNIVIKLLTHFIGILIIISTLFIKQHYVLDIVSGIAIAGLVYAVINLTDSEYFFGIRNYYKNKNSHKRV